MIKPVPAVMQRENERSRVAVPGKCTDDGERCTLVVVHEVAGGCWAFYPHDFGKFGVRLDKMSAVKVAQEIMAGAEFISPGKNIHSGQKIGLEALGTTQLPDQQGRFTISKDFELDGVSHELRLLPEGHKCRRNHGHNYVVTLTLTADRLDEYGFVTDFGKLASFGDYLKSTFDHQLLNDVIDLHPTSELFAYHLGCWFIENVEPQVNGRLMSVRVAETRLSSALWERFDAL